MIIRGKSIVSPRSTHGGPLGFPTRTILLAGMGTSPVVLTKAKCVGIGKFDILCRGDKA